MATLVDLNKAEKLTVAELRDVLTTVEREGYVTYTQSEYEAARLAYQRIGRPTLNSSWQRPWSR